MAVGFPAKTDFADGGYLTAALQNDITGTLNLKRYSGETLLTTTAVTNIASVSITGISSAYSHLRIVLSNLATVSTSVTIRCTLNANSGSVYSFFNGYSGSTTPSASRTNTAIDLTTLVGTTANVNKISGELFIPRYTDTANYKTVDYNTAYIAPASAGSDILKGSAMTTDTTAITSIQFAPSSGNWTAQGNIYVYGIA